MAEAGHSRGAGLPVIPSLVLVAAMAISLGTWIWVRDDELHHARERIAEDCAVVARALTLLSGPESWPPAPERLDRAGALLVRPSSLAVLEPGRPAAAFVAEQPLPGGGEGWRLGCGTWTEFESQTQADQQILVLLSGMVLSLALWGAAGIAHGSRQRLREFVGNASEWVWETDSGHRLSHLSERFGAITGIAPDPLLGQTLWDIAGPRQIAAGWEVWGMVFRSIGSHRAFRGLHLAVADVDGVSRHLLLSGQPCWYDNGVFRGYRGTGTDITELKRAEAAVRQSAARLRAAIEAMPSGLIMFDDDLNVMVYNRKFLELWQVSEAELLRLGRMPALVRHLAERGAYGPGEVESQVAQRVRAICQATTQVYELTLADGRTLEVSSFGRSEVGYVLTYLDITERKRSEDAIRQGEARLKLALAATRAGVWDVDLIQRRRWWSPEFADLLGWSAEELAKLEDVVGVLVHPDDRAEVFRRAKLHLNGVSAEFRAQYRLRRGDGGWQWVEDVGQVIRDAAGTPVRFIGTLMDMTERRAAQAELLRSERMAALGRLVAGVAHEINTPVGLGLSVASHLEQKCRQFRQHYEQGELTQEDLDEYVQASREATDSLLFNLRRAADLVRSFKQVAVDQTRQQRRSFKVKGYIEEVLISLRPKLRGTRHEVVLECPEELAIYSDPGALSQILTNLVENSLVHGFEGIARGQITIAVQNEISVAVLIYSDNGKGMLAEQVERIFDPFYTTRMGQGGSGLGMHIVYNLVTQTLGGHIACVSAPGQGLRITVRLPVGQDPAP
jgi:PAS domain S-box-containing protein